MEVCIIDHCKKRVQKLSKHAASVAVVPHWIISRQCSPTTPCSVGNKGKREISKPSEAIGCRASLKEQHTHVMCHHSRLCLVC